MSKINSSHWKPLCHCSRTQVLYNGGAKLFMNSHWFFCSYDSTWYFLYIYYKIWKFWSRSCEISNATSEKGCFFEKLFHHANPGNIKGQLISKRLFGFFNSPKKRTKNFCPSRLGQKLTFSSSFFGRIEDTKISFRD